MLCLCLQVGDQESREQLIKTHYMARVGELTTQLQISDSKAVHFHSEVNVYLSHCFLYAIAFHTGFFLVVLLDKESIGTLTASTKCPSTEQNSH